jgi:hypothetical protein
MRDSNRSEIGKMNIRDMVQKLTRGRPYLFFIMSYNSRWDFYERIRRFAEGRFNVACVRADEVKSSGHDLLAKIHLLISRAELVIAEISEPTENVFYEVGYAVGIGKLPILLVEKDGKVPADLRGLEVVRYGLDRQGLCAFDAELVDHLRVRLNSELALLRDMLEAPSPRPAYIVASPKYPGKHSRILGQVYDTRTFGDHIGILGLISAMGSLWGESAGIELVSAQHSPPDLHERPQSLYLIGSEKVNHASGKLLAALQANRRPNWVFDPVHGFTRRDEDWPCGLYRVAGNRRELLNGRTEKRGPSGEDVWVEDYGIIVRGPHPKFPERLVMIMAGAKSLGTGAACFAATRSVFIQRIRSKLPEGVLEDKTSSFWVLVKGTAARDGLLDADGVSIEEAGVYR